MERRKRTALYVIAKLFNYFAVLINILLSFSGVGVTYAAETTYADDSKILSELERITIDGKKFGAADYPADSEGTPTVLYLNEIGYRFAGVQDLYALTLYIYNPSQINVVDDARNQIQMRIGNEERFGKYDIKLEDISADKLFCKFAVAFKNGERQAALGAQDKDERVYELSNIELYVSGFNATDFSFGQTRIYTYKGYAAGLGENGTTENTLTGTLSYTVAGGTKVKRLSVKHTSWRPEGTNGNSSWTQDTIHSVYFAVPKEYDEKYDYLNSVNASWAEARLMPTYVTDNKELLADLEAVWQYNLSKATKIEDFCNQYKIDEKTNFNWAMVTWPEANSAWDFGYSEYFYGREAAKHHIESQREVGSIKNDLRWLPLFAYSNDGNLTANELSDLVQSRANDIISRYPDIDKIYGKYPADFFTMFTKGKVPRTIRLGEKSEKEKDNELIVTSDDLILHSEQVKQSWWQKISGDVSVKNKEDFEGIDAIKLITEEDRVLDKTPKQLGDSLYISERDAQAFKDFYRANKDENKIYLMRFAVSEYWVQPTHEYRRSNLFGDSDDLAVWINRGTVNDRDGYFAYDTCYIDFDIINFEYKKNDKSYVIPVSMSPVDIFSELTPLPVYEDNAFWKYALVIIAGLVVVGVVYGLIYNEVRKTRGN